MIHDVVIAGAGPVGLFLACELRLARLSVLVLEQAENPHSPLKRTPFGMRGLSVAAVEAFYRRRLLDDIATPPGVKEASDGTARMAARDTPLPRRLGGHFAGIPYSDDNVDLSKWPYLLPGPSRKNVAVEIEHLESVLTARAHSAGVEIRRGIGVEGVDVSGEGVVVRSADDTIRGRWLVGCDGGRSSVRKACGFEFVGTEPEFTCYSVEIVMNDPDELPLGRHYTATGMYMHSRPGTVAMVEFDGGAFHRSRAITCEHVQGVLRRVSGIDISVEAVKLATTWTDRAFQVTTYRQGRVLLAGDAAHIHSPLGGQGLNLGLGDAMNLGWKLASTIRSDGPVSLLDTYSRERHPVGAQILDWSRSQVALMRPTPSSRALEGIVRDLIDTRDGATYFSGRISGVDLRYDLGDTHPLVGRSAPDFELDNGAKLGELMMTGTGLLLDFAANEMLRKLAGCWPNRIAYVARKAKNQLGLTALLVRPDGIVGWASDATPDAAEVARAASRWFGDPEDSV